MNTELKVIIVEDEIASQNYLKRLLGAHFPELRIVAVEDTVGPAIGAINHERPDLVFMDVEIRQGTGFEVLDGLDGATFGLIFTTAFNQFAIDAFQHHAIDYLLKPLDDDRVIGAVRRSIAQQESQRSQERIHHLLEYLQKTALPRLPVSTIHGFEFIDIESILYVEASGNYCKIKLKSGNSITTTRKIKEITGQLSEPLFIRVHHSYLVHTRYIKRYQKGRGGYVELDDGTAIPVSPQRKDDFLKHFS